MSDLHPNGQLPAYAWHFGDVDPPAPAWPIALTCRLQMGLHQVAEPGMARARAAA